MTQESACVLNKESLYTPIPAFEARVSKWPERLWATILNYKIFSTTIQQGTNRIIWVQCVSLRFIQKLGKCLWILWSIIIQMRINIFTKLEKLESYGPSVSFVVCLGSLATSRHLRSDIVNFGTHSLLSDRTWSNKDFHPIFEEKRECPSVNGCESTGLHLISIL